MDYLLALIFGIVQGITEFLPISSSGHLIILHNFFELPIENKMAFDVTLHLATILSVLICFFEEVKKLVCSFVKSLKGKKDDYSKTAWLLVIATIPAAFFGYLFDDLIEEGIHRSQEIGIIVVIAMLILVAILFIIVERKKPQEGLFTSLSLKNALLIGFAQALALIPGTSRSGVTILAGLQAGLKRSEALKFSFLLSIPIVLGASAKKIPSLFEQGIVVQELTIVLVAFVSALLTGLWVIRFFLKYAQNNSLNIFAYYRIALAMILIIYLNVR